MDAIIVAKIRSQMERGTLDWNDPEVKVAGEYLESEYGENLKDVAKAQKAASARPALKPAQGIEDVEEIAKLRGEVVPGNSESLVRFLAKAKPWSKPGDAT